MKTYIDNENNTTMYYNFSNNDIQEIVNEFMKLADPNEIWLGKPKTFEFQGHTVNIFYDFEFNEVVCLTGGGIDIDGNQVELKDIKKIDKAIQKATKAKGWY